MASQPHDDPSPSAPGPNPQRWPLRRLIAATLAATILLSILAICQQFYGIGPRVRFEIPANRVQSMDAGYARWRLPEIYRTSLTEQRLRFDQNGHNWPSRAGATRDLPQLGPGWFHVNDGGVNFVPHRPGDLTDPSVSYGVSVPLQFKPRIGWILGALLLAQTLLFLRLSPSTPSGGLISALRWGHTGGDPARSRADAVLFLAALAGILTTLLLREPPTDHAFMVKGMPESDALAWHEMAIGLSEGLGFTGGFSNQRPFYAVYVGSLFTWFQPRLLLTHSFHALCLALSAAAVFTIGRLLGSRWLGLVLAAGLVSAASHLDFVHAILTENVGLVLAVLSVLAAWHAAWTLSRRWAFAGGLLNGLAALTSGVTLLTLPFYALILLVFPLTRRTAWQRAVTLAALYTMAATLVVGPWIVRQKIVNGRFTLSYNTAEVFAGGSDPDSGRLTAAVFTKAKAAGLNPDDPHARYDFFMRAFRENVAADPAAYVRRVAGATLDSLRYLPFREPGFEVALLLALLGFALSASLLHGHWLSLPVAFGVMTAWVTHPDVQPPLVAALLVTGAYLLWRCSSTPAIRLLTLLLIATVLAVMLLAGLSGNVAARRFWLVADWSVLALILGGARQFIALAGSAGHQLLHRLRRAAGAATAADLLAPTSHPPAALSPSRFAGVACAGWLLFSAAAGLTLLAVHVRGPDAPLSGLDSLDASRLLTQAWPQVVSREPSLASLPETALATRLVCLDDLAIHLEAEEGARHWVQIYARRPYDRWVAKMRIYTPQGTLGDRINVLGRGQLDAVPRHTPLLLGGRLTEVTNRLSGLPTRLFEARFALPLHRSSPDSPWQPDLEHLVVFPPTPEALATLPQAPPPGAPTAPAPAQR